MKFHCYVLLQFSPTFTVESEAGGTHACVPPAHIGQHTLEPRVDECSFEVLLSFNPYHAWGL